MKRYLYLPKQYDLIVGDTFELFYRGITNFLTINGYDFELFYEDGKNRGKGFSRKYVFTPEVTDVGVHILHVRLWSNEGEVLEEGSVRINVAMPPKSPKTERVFLLIGASDTEPGIWPAEFCRRLTAADGMPCGLALKNVSFIGSREKGGVRYEGYGGWTFDSYSTKNVDCNAFMYIDGDFSDKDPTADQHSFYTDSGGFDWKLESITKSRIKLICTRIVGKLPSFNGGRLVHKSGGKNTGDIVYTKAEYAEANPFWSNALNRCDFRAYAKKFGKEKIDEIVVTLTWNSHDKTVDEYRKSMQRFISAVHRDFPDCHITLVGGYFPSRDGFANNYGISWPWFKKMDVLRAFDAVREELYASDPARLSFVHASSQYDMDNNCLSAEFVLNARNNNTEMLGSNGLHVSLAGQNQLADAIWRHIAARLAREE